MEMPDSHDMAPRVRARSAGRAPAGRAKVLLVAAVLILGGCATPRPARADALLVVPAAERMARPSVADPGPVEHEIEVPATPPSREPHASASGAEDPLEIELDTRPTSFPDPFEPVNRRTLHLNQTVDHWVVAPVTRAYGYVVPDRAKRSVRDFFANLESPAIFVNDVLQGELGNAATTVARFSVNTVVGLGGLFDPATAMGLERHRADFGQTLARNGFASGPFLIVPLLGPTTVRDGIGTLVDVALQPTIYLLGPTPLFVATVQEGTSGLTLREAHGEDLQRLEQASLDYYAALRSAYYQNRMASLALEPAHDDAPAGDPAAVAATPLRKGAPPT